MPATADKTNPQLGKSPPNNKKTATAEQPPGRATRETIESVVVAIILAFLFRTFEAEAFVIPTGSMAPTLQGAHRDVVCPQCGFQYRTGASDEPKWQKEIVAGVCPICRYTHIFDKEANPNEATFSGDRILVSKIAYQIGEPERFDPIVFKFPGNPKVNYIKRLIGLPGEEGFIRHGDVFVKGTDDAEHHIIRKPPHKLAAMLQLVDDTNYIAPALRELKWPSRWDVWRPAESKSPASWTIDDSLNGFATDGQGDESYIRYRHHVPFSSDWTDLAAGKLPPDVAPWSPDKKAKQERRGQLISDFYAYNAEIEMLNIPLNVKGSPETRSNYSYLRAVTPPEQWRETVYDEIVERNIDRGIPARHWVGDLAVECDVTVESDSGELILDLVEGGVHYQCRIDAATGVAKLSIDGGQTPFIDRDGNETQFPETATDVKGPGKYTLRFANCDDELTLWVNGDAATFSAPATYANRPDCRPRVLPGDDGDLLPAGIGSKGAAIRVSGLKIYRDVYYIANGGEGDSDYASFGHDITKTFTTPELWEEAPDGSDLFSSRRSFEFGLQEDQFYTLGDNSPASMDARSWARGEYQVNDPPYLPVAPKQVSKFVKRELLIGKALLIYWPHAWNRPIPWTPNVERMGLIR